MKNYLNYIREQQDESEYEKIEEFIIFEIVKAHAGSLKNAEKVFFDIHKKVVNKKIIFTSIKDKNGNSECTVIVKNTFMKTFIKDEQKHIYTYTFYIVDENGKEYILSVGDPIKVYKIINRKLDPYGEDDW